MPLHIIIPVSHADFNLLPSRAQALKKFGPYQGHRLTVVPTQDVPLQLAQEFKASLDGLFDMAEVKPVTITGKRWPLGPNQHFRECAKIAREQKMYWMFLELDSCPLRKGWLNELDSEMKHAEMSGKIHLGAIVPTRGFELRPSGEKVPVNGEPHLVGFAIYHPDLASLSVKLATVDRQFNFSPLTLEPFDVAMRHELTPRAYPSSLIQHNLRTANYRKEGEQIVCDAMEAASIANPINPKACILHGVKDDSLCDLILGVEVVPGKSPHVTASLDAGASGGNEALTHTPPSADVPGSGDKPKAGFLAFQARKLLNEGKGWRLKDMAAHLKVEIDVLKNELTNTASGLEITNPGWVRVKSVSQ